MHRSRTSWIAKTLHENGISMGHHLLPADRNNEHGYYEDTEIVKANAEILGGNSQIIDNGKTTKIFQENHLFDINCSSRGNF